VVVGSYVQILLFVTPDTLWHQDACSAGDVPLLALSILGLVPGCHALASAPFNSSAGPIRGVQGSLHLTVVVIKYSLYPKVACGDSFNKHKSRSFLAAVDAPVIAGDSRPGCLASWQAWMRAKGERRTPKRRPRDLRRRGSSLRLRRITSGGIGKVRDKSIAAIFMLRGLSLARRLA